MPGVKRWVAAGLLGLCAFHDGFARKLDRNLLRPLRDYHATLADHNSFRTQEDFARLCTELARGAQRMLTVERSD